MNPPFLAEAYDWCVVPDSGYDAVLFAGVAVLAACCLQGKFSALWILLAGEPGLKDCGPRRTYMNTLLVLCARTQIELH